MVDTYIKTTTNTTTSPIFDFEIFNVKIYVYDYGLLYFLVTLFIINKVASFFNSAFFKASVVYLQQKDIELIDEIDDLIVELRSIIDADRVQVVLLHNGISNPIFHWKKLSCIAESVKSGITKISSLLQSINIQDIFTQADIINLNLLKNTDDSCTIFSKEDIYLSRKLKLFCTEISAESLYISPLLNPKEPNKPYGFIFVQWLDKKSNNYKICQHPILDKINNAIIKVSKKRNPIQLILKFLKNVD